MLAIGIKLNSAIVPMPISVFNTCLECTRETKIAGQIQKRVAVIMANLNSPVAGAVVNDQVVIIGNDSGKLTDRRPKGLLFVIGWNNNQCLQNGLT